VCRSNLEAGGWSIGVWKLTGVNKSSELVKKRELDLCTGTVLDILLFRLHHVSIVWGTSPGAGLLIKAPNLTGVHLPQGW
jgi:hypothetical protein